MRNYLVLVLLLMVLSAATMAEQAAPLKASESGSYAEIAHRANPEKHDILFIPALVELLHSAECKNGAPLTEAQVEAIRDSAIVIVSPASARIAAEAQGYTDINAADVWNQWQAARKELGM